MGREGGRGERDSGAKKRVRQEVGGGGQCMNVRFTRSAAPLYTPRHISGLPFINLNTLKG